MTTKSFHTSILGRPLILAICCTALTMGCDNSKPEPRSKPGLNNEGTEPLHNVERVQAESSKTDEEQSPGTQSAISKTPGQLSTPEAKPLDLSRGENLRGFDQNIDTTEGDPDSLLPNLFDGKQDKTGPRASGRVLMNETEKASLQSIEGVEFKLEIPVN